jgi:putative peptide zinc metalloprotease protein
VPELIAEIEKASGMEGVQRLVELLAELSDCGLLADCAAGERPLTGGSRLRRLMRPRELVLSGAPDAVDRIYRAGAFACFTAPALALMAGVTAAGFAAFAAVVASGEVRPLHVAGQLSVGAAAFLAGRLAVVTLHELGHALTLASFGRRSRRIGFKLILVFPYGFVDTSEGWFEPRRRRIAVSAAGPITDGFLAGACSLVALAGAGSARSVAFQLALGAYLGMLLNLNPMLERDGYHALVDVLGEPDLRRRARAQLTRRLAGRSSSAAEPRSVALYGVATLVWSIVAACFAGAMTLRSADHVIGRPSPLAWALAAIVLVLALVPVALTLVPPLRLRRESAR